MRLLVAGSRSVATFDLSAYIPSDTELIISGGAKGIDAIAEQYADRHGISKLVLRPDYKRYGRAAPLRRNLCMVELADAVLAVWDGISKGTQYTIECARRENKPLTVVMIEGRKKGDTNLK